MDLFSSEDSDSDDLAEFLVTPQKQPHPATPAVKLTTCRQVTTAGQEEQQAGVLGKRPTPAWWCQRF